MASALENFVNNVRTLSASANFRELAEHLNQTIELLSKNWMILDNVLETLDLQQHTLGVLYVLIAKFNSPTNHNGDLSNLVRLFKNFINYCNEEQLLFAPLAYYELCHTFTNCIIDQPACFMGIQIMACAIEKIGLFETQLTPIHSDLCQLSLKARYFKTALKFLNCDVTSIVTSLDNKAQNSSDASNDTKYFLLYYYYGGMIYASIKNYNRALYFFEVCIATPAMAMSHIMLEAYKKFILVSLILYGKVLPIPKYSSQIISRFMKPIAQIYHDLANAYGTSSCQEVRTIMNKYMDAFTRDNNIGLVKQVIESLYKKNIQQLPKTFATLSLSEVASRAQLSTASDAETFVLDMIKFDELNATMDQKDNIIVFLDNPEKYNSFEMFLKIQGDLTTTMESLKRINKLEEEILLSPLYIKKAIGTHEEELASQHSKSYAG